MKYYARYIAVLILIPAVICSCGKEARLERERAIRMQDFVTDISLYARGIKPGFIIIPQNGIELAFRETDMSEGFRTSYINAIDGMGIEELFYNDEGKKIKASDSDQKEKLAMLGIITAKTDIRIMVADFVSSDSYIDDSIDLCQKKGFIPFVRSYSNYHYKFIPAGPPPGVNSNNINKLSDAQNYLYLISTDNYGTKQAMVDAIAGTDYDVVLIDLFFEKESLTAADLAQLRNKNNGGKRLVIAYMNIGSAETFRYYFEPEWKLKNPSWLAKKYEGYDDEFWVEYWNDQWRKIIFGNEDSYLDKIINAGFDGVYLDNVEAYYFLGKGK